MSPLDRPILVAVDAGDGADEAIRQADARARHHGCGLVACSAFPDLVQLNALAPRHGLPIDVLAVRTRIEASVRERVAGLTRRAPEEFDVRVLAGAPHAAIIREAERLGARLVVVGARSRRGLGDALIGSVAQRTVRHAGGPVLVARPRPLSGHVVVATDFSDPALPALVAAGEEVRRIGGRLTAVHCVDLEELEWVTGALASSQASLDLGEEALAVLLREAEGRLRAALELAGIPGEVQGVLGRPGPAIVAAASELGAEIVIVGTSGRTGLRRVTLGSVAEAVVATADTSVLVVRLEEED